MGRCGSLMVGAARQPHGWCAYLQIAWSRFEPWPGLPIVFLGKTLLTLTVPLSTPLYKYQQM